MTDLISRTDADAAIVACKGNGATRQACRDAIASLPAVTVGDSLWLQFGPMGEVESVSDEPLEGHQEYARILAALEPVTAPDPAAIREAALREAYYAVGRIVERHERKGDFRAEEIAGECHDAILALIWKGATE